MDIATVAEWHDEDGWGVLHSPQTPGGCWAHFSALAGDGYRTLDPGAEVAFTFEEGPQDGYPFRAVEIWWPGEQPATEQPRQPRGGSSAYQSSLTITLDDGTVLSGDEVQDLLRRAEEGDFGAG